MSKHAEEYHDSYFGLDLDASKLGGIRKNTTIDVLFYHVEQFDVCISMAHWPFTLYCYM